MLKNKLFWILILLSLMLVGSVGAEVNLIDGLVSYWKFDENTGTTASDSHGTNDGTITGATWTTGKINYGLDFDGTNDKTQVSETFDFIQNTGTFTISTWIKLDDYTPYKSQSILGNGIGGTADKSWNLAYDNRAITGSNKRINFNIGKGTTGTYGVSSSCNNSIADNDFNHIVVKGTGTIIEILINDVSCVNTSITGLSSGASTYTNTRFGVLANDASWLNGKIDETAIYNRTLNSTEITQLYNSGTGLQYPFATLEFLSNQTYPATPLINENVTLNIEVNSTNSINYCNFTAVLPNSTIILNNSNGTYTQVGDITNWNSTPFNATLGGSYEWNVTCEDNESNQVSLDTQTFWIINNSLTIDDYNISIQEPDYLEPFKPLLNFTTDYETYQTANASIYVNDVLNRTEELTCDTLTYNSYNCSGIDWNETSGDIRIDFLVEYNDSINATAQINISIVAGKIYSSPDDSYLMSVFNSTAYNKEFNISVWQFGDYELDYNLSCEFEEANITIANPVNFSVNGTTIDDATKLQVNVSVTTLADGEYNGSCNITRIADGEVKQINLTYYKNPPMAQVRLLEGDTGRLTFGDICTEELITGTCSRFAVKTDDDTFTYDLITENFGEYDAHQCNAVLENDFVGTAYYSFNATNFSIPMGERVPIEISLFEIPSGEYQGNLKIRCENASGFGYSVENEPSNRPAYYLSISEASIVPPSGGGGGGADLPEDDEDEEVVGTCDNVTIEPQEVKFIKNGLREITIFNYQSASYSPSISVNGTISNYVSLTNQIDLLPQTKGEVGIQYEATNFTEGEAIITLTDTCGVKEIYITALSEDSDEIIDLLFNSFKDFLLEPVFGKDQAWREDTQLFTIASLWLVFLLISTLLLYNNFKTSFNKKNYIKFTALIFFTFLLSFVLMFVAVNLLRSI